MEADTKGLFFNRHQSAKYSLCTLKEKKFVVNEPYHMYIIINLIIKDLSDKQSCLVTLAHAQRLQYQGRRCAAYATRPIFTFSSLRTQYLVHHRMGTYGTCLPCEFAFVRSEIKGLLTKNITITHVDLSVAFLTVN